MNIDHYKPYFTGKLCQYCNSETELIDSAEVYHGISYGWMYICRKCGAYVGCYTGTKEALGMVAKAELRLEKRKAHHYFDQLWKGKHFKSRFAAYNWLSKQLGIPREYTHIGMSDVDQCKQICRISIDRMSSNSQEIIPFEDTNIMKPYIICHMMASVDGRIDCAMTEKIEGGDAYYEALDELNVPTTVIGRVTAAMHYAQDGLFKAEKLTPINKKAIYNAIERLDLENVDFMIVFDSRGTLLWDSNIVNNHPLICVVSEDVSEDYLQYLRQKDISYIATGKSCIDLSSAVRMLAEYFKIERMGLVGGGKLNGSFLKAGLIDEMSLMIGPGIDGRTGQPSVFDGIDNDAEPVKLTMNSVKTFDCGTVWIRYSVNKQDNEDNGYYRQCP